MQNVMDMIEVQHGIFVPTVESVLTDDWGWCVSNKGYNCVLDRATKVILFAFSDDVDGVAYAHDNYTEPTYIVGGLPKDDDLILGGVFI